MALTLNIRRAVMLGLALLLFLAVAGPACLLAASEAMAMSMGTTHSSAPMDCGGEGEGPTMACPHDDPVEVTAGASGSTVSIPLDVVFTAGEPALTTTEFARFSALAELAPVAPPSHMTPLRI
jgi:hypothetical protein